MKLYLPHLITFQSILSDLCAALIFTLITLKSLINLLFYLFLIIIVYLLAVKFQQLIQKYV
ncbi:hypothetical protein CO006_03140 [Candidatus Roizmanbacteria bacterium CG_4_8_14_3_um_filter_35_14]|uniref:Uncharacterized protein n=1 Tax=Candidatus Roizmanbacteria bacterium CG_4_9_14_0_2_um_filter_35_15 TaxID=1974836 RepID=A0A2M8F3U8_9BACT|nr:MAG: hypothetical protein CO048_01665 [Candidatus Roizmanbacteria bacterium CG_4_9_14_0_2_um_filter_35_15]PJC82520.1 MAG: hypothetical protein CO006_03140 [Candidatus Roizmanbacteria bacterium CG_4_8_14_3_um_filter_35_14]